MRISDWSSDVCSSDLCRLAGPCGAFDAARAWRNEGRRFRRYVPADPPGGCAPGRETPEQARHPTRPRCTCALLGWLQFRALWHSASISPRKKRANAILGHRPRIGIGLLDRELCCDFDALLGQAEVFQRERKRVG